LLKIQVHNLHVRGKCVTKNDPEGLQCVKSGPMEHENDPEGLQCVKSGPMEHENDLEALQCVKSGLMLPAVESKAMRWTECVWQ